MRDTDSRQPTAAVAEPAVGTEPDRYEAIVIGAGQAGLAIGYFLARQGRRFTILEASDAVGAAWRARWDSLVLFTRVATAPLPALLSRAIPMATRLATT